MQLVSSICLAIIIAFMKNRIILTDDLVLVYYLIMLVTGLLSLVAPIVSLGNKILRNWHNEEAIIEMHEKGYEWPDY